MKVLLLKDVYKLGRAGDVKKVADGYGRNFLLPKGLAVLATPGALKQTEHIRTKAAVQRTALNTELSGVSDQITRIVLLFGVKAGETGKLYGSISTQMIADAINKKLGAEKVDRHQVEVQTIRTLGEFKAHVRLTMDLIPELRIIVHREGEVPANLLDEETQAEVEEAQIEEEAATESVDESLNPVAVDEEDTVSLGPDA